MKSKYLEMELRTSPHASQPVDVPIIMRNVVYSMLPLVAMAFYLFGLAALLQVVVATASALGTEYLISRWADRRNTLTDFSAAITGILLGLTLPPAFPLWMTTIGGIVSISLGKSLFGGLGFNSFNPALVGRAFLQAAFPVAITTWSLPFASDRFVSLPQSLLAIPLMKAAPLATTGATPLGAFKFDGVTTGEMSLMIGTTAGSVGETSAGLILLCGLYLAARKMLDWRIPVGVLGSVFVLSGFLHWMMPDLPSPWFMLLSGGLMLGAFFMATDMVTSPVTPLGVWLYAMLIGVLTVVIRLWGGLPEGVMYAILLGNAVTPLLNLVTQPRIYGQKAKA